MSDKKEWWDWDIITLLCDKSGDGIIGEFDREATRALKTAYEAEKQRADQQDEEIQALALECATLKDENIKLKTALGNILSMYSEFIHNDVKMQIKEMIE